jgi:hypothetical protein
LFSVSAVSQGKSQGRTKFSPSAPPRSAREPRRRDPGACRRLRSRPASTVPQPAAHAAISRHPRNADLPLRWRRRGHGRRDERGRAPGARFLQQGKLMWPRAPAAAGEPGGEGGRERGEGGHALQR